MNPINKTVHDFKHFIQWLFGKDVQRSMPGDGRDFRRKITKFWEIWPMPPKIENPMNVVYVDGIYLSRKACILYAATKKMYLDGICAAMRIPEHGKH